MKEASTEANDGQAKVPIRIDIHIHMDHIHIHVQIHVHVFVLTFSDVHATLIYGHVWSCAQDPTRALRFSVPCAPLGKLLVDDLGIRRLDVMWLECVRTRHRAAAAHTHALA